jgi:hypothetical protein
MTCLIAPWTTVYLGCTLFDALEDLTKEFDKIFTDLSELLGVTSKSIYAVKSRTAPDVMYI